MTNIFVLTFKLCTFITMQYIDYIALVWYY